MPSNLLPLPWKQRTNILKDMPDASRNTPPTFAKKMALSKEYLEDIILGGLLHDIGKIGIKEPVLDKNGKLTKAEYDHIQTHVLTGERILTPIIKNETVIRVVRHHHEHIDGSGYPDGLKGKTIPLEARIVAVADTYDALLSERPYRRKPPTLQMPLKS